MFTSPFFRVPGSSIFWYGWNFSQRQPPMCLHCLLLADPASTTQDSNCSPTQANYSGQHMRMRDAVRWTSFKVTGDRLCHRLSSWEEFNKTVPPVTTGVVSVIKAEGWCCNIKAIGTFLSRWVLGEDMNSSHKGAVYGSSLEWEEGVSLAQAKLNTLS